jgi:hypothetical protein
MSTDIPTPFGIPFSRGELTTSRAIEMTWVRFAALSFALLMVGHRCISIAGTLL